MNKIFIIDKTYNTPWENLAYEEALVHYVSKQLLSGFSTAGLYLWQNDNTIVIGRNQNPLRECNMKFVEENGIRLARRLTGGGAVYHDLGNLNFSFIVPNMLYDKQKNYNILISGLKRLYIDAEVSGRNDILLDGKKISGIASANLESVILHHGTLLVSSDNTKIQGSLTPNLHKLKSKGIVSVSSRVTNITRYNSWVTIEDIKKSLVQSFQEAYGDNIENVFITPQIDEQRFLNNVKIYSSKEWIFGENLDEFILIEKDWGTVRFNIDEKDGAIKECRYETDSLEIKLLESFFDNLKGVALNHKCLDKYAVAYCLKSNLENRIIIEDIINAIKRELK